MKKKTLKINVGDCFAYQIKDNLEYRDRYIVLCAVESPINDENTNRYDFFLTKITQLDILPRDEEEINNLENIISSVTFMEDRFMPLDFFSPIEPQIRKLSKIKVYPDKMDYLYSYFLRMKITRWTQMNQLIYLGNFNIKIPQNNFVPFHWSYIYFDLFENLEYSSIKHYKEYNLKKLEIWHLSKEKRESRKKKSELFINSIAKDVQEKDKL